MLRALTLLVTALLVGCGKPDPVDTRAIQFTAEERAYIQEKKTITWAAEENRPPFIYRKNGLVVGLSAEYINVISKKTGLKFKPVPVKNLKDALDSVNIGKIDLVTTVRPASSNDRIDLRFTAPYVYDQGVFVFRRDAIPESPMRVGICEGDASAVYLQERFPDMKVVTTRDVEESISLLEKGLIDSAIMNEASANYFGRKSKIAMRAAGTDFDYPNSMGVRKENKILGSILGKAINSISPKEKKQMNDAWKKER